MGKNMHGRRAEIAFSAAELLIAIALLALVITVVMGLFVKLMNASTKGLDQTVALDIAQNKLDYTGSSTPAVWLRWYSQPVGGLSTKTQFWFSNTTASSTITGEAHYMTDARTPTLFYYTLVATELSSPGAGGKSSFSSPFNTNQMGDVYKLDMDVYWWPQQEGSQNSQATRSEYGRLSVHLDRIVYIENMKP